MAPGEVDDAELGRIDIGDRQRVLQASAKGRGLQMLTRGFVHVQPTETALVQWHRTAFGTGKNCAVASRLHHIGEMRQLSKPQPRGIGA
ncbi:hypothetical protein D3C71_1920300 [compost metagenome]